MSYRTRFKLLILIIEILVIFTLFLALDPLVTYAPATLKVYGFLDIHVVEHSTLSPSTSLTGKHLFLNPNSSMMLLVAQMELIIPSWYPIIPCAYFLHSSCGTHGTYFVLLFLVDHLRDCILFIFVLPCPTQWLAQR